MSIPGAFYTGVSRAQNKLELVNGVQHSAMLCPACIHADGRFLEDQRIRSGLVPGVRLRLPAVTDALCTIERRVYPPSLPAIVVSWQESHDDARGKVKRQAQLALWGISSAYVCH